jgi:hypothetical protein
MPPTNWKIQRNLLSTTLVNTASLSDSFYDQYYISLKLYSTRLINVNDVIKAGMRARCHNVSYSDDDLIHISLNLNVIEHF